MVFYGTGLAWDGQSLNLRSPDVIANPGGTSWISSNLLLSFQLQMTRSSHSRELGEMVVFPPS